MIHILTMGHLDPAAVGRRQALVLRPLDMGIVNRLLQELGGTGRAGTPDARRRAGGDQGRHGGLSLVDRWILQPCRRGVRPPAPRRNGDACWPTGSTAASSSRISSKDPTGRRRPPVNPKDGKECGHA